MGNCYTVLFQRPADDAAQLASAYEMLAKELLQSGLLRLHTESAKNFVTYCGPDYDMTFSKREVTDPNLLPDTKQAIARTLPGSAKAPDIEEVLGRLRQQFRTTGDLDEAREMQVARLLVQACEPVIIQLILLERVQVFVSYSHNVADLMAVHFWEQMEGSGGLQATSGDGKAVYVSCGGNPFIRKDEHKTYKGDGFNALARMQVIAGQELGHYADLLRNEHGQLVGRHAATLAPFKARPHVREARANDIEQTRYWQYLSGKLNLRTCKDLEEALAFYQEHRKRSFRIPFTWWQARDMKREIINIAEENGWHFFSHFPHHLHPKSGWAMHMTTCLQDMAFNLEPNADAYRRDDPHEEEAILCIEALARVPQQVNKWGHVITQQCWPNLYRIYYEEVIPANKAAYEVLSGKKYFFPDVKPTNPSMQTRYNPLKLLGLNR